MRTATVRINSTAHLMLHHIAEQCEESMQSCLTKAIEVYRRQIFLQRANKAFASLQANPKAWQDETKERLEWDSALLDDIEDS